MKLKAIKDWLLKDRQIGKTPLTQSLSFLGILSVFILFAMNARGVDVLEKLDDARSFYLDVSYSPQSTEVVQTKVKRKDLPETELNLTTAETQTSFSKTKNENLIIHGNKDTKFSRIALYPLNYSHYSLESGKNHRNGRGMSEFVTSSLMIELTKSKRFELLDRSHLSTLFAEKSRILTNNQNGFNSESLAKLPLSEFTLLGSLFVEDEIKFYNLKLIRNNTGEVFGIQKFRFSFDNIQQAIQQSLDFVHKSLELSNKPIASIQNKTKARRKIAFGHFIDVSKDDSLLDQGQNITDRLIEKFLKNKNNEILSRTQMLPLVIEEYLRKLQYTDESQVSERANAKYLVHGKFRNNPLDMERPLSVYLYLDLIENGRELVVLKARNWDHAFDLIDKATVEFIPEAAVKVSAENVKKSREMIIKAIGLSDKSQKNFYLKNGLLSQFKIKEFAEHQSISSTKNSKKYILSQKLIKQALMVDPENHVAKLIQAMFFKATGDDIWSTKKLNEVIRHEDSAVQDEAISLLDEILRERNGAEKFKEIIGSDQAVDIYETLVKENYLTEQGNLVEHKKADQVFNRTHTLSLDQYDPDMNIQIFETLRSLNYRPGTQIYFKKPNSYYTKNIHKKLRSWNQVTFLDQHNIEAVLFSNIASTAANVYLNTETSLPSVEFYPNLSDETKERISYQLKIAADAFASSVYLDPSYLRAGVLLGFSLCRAELEQCETGEMIHTWVVENTSKANLKGSGGMYFNVTRDIMVKDRLIFLAADAIDRVDDANLTEMFRGTLIQEEYYVKKAKKKLQELIQ